MSNDQREYSTVTTHLLSNRAELWRRSADGTWRIYDRDTDEYMGDTDRDGLTFACREWLGNLGITEGEWFMRWSAVCDSDVVTLSEVSPQ